MDELREWTWLIYPLLIGYFLYEVFKWLKNVFLSIKYYKDRFDYDYEMIDKRMDILQSNMEILKCVVEENRYSNRREFHKYHGDTKDEYMRKEGFTEDEVTKHRIKSYDEIELGWDKVRDKREELEEELLDFEVEYKRMVESRSKLRRGFDVFADVIEREKKKNRKKN